jgi:hypothetical protein
MRQPERADANKELASAIEHRNLEHTLAIASNTPKSSTIL